MNTRLCLFVLFFSLTLTALAYGQGQKKPRTLDDYRARTLQELSAIDDKLEPVILVEQVVP